MRRLTWLIGMLLIALVVVACGGGEDNDQNRTPLPSATAIPPTIPPELVTPTPTPTATALPQPITDNDPLTRAELRVTHASADLPSVDLYLDGANIGRGFKRGNYHTSPLTFTPGTYTLRVVAAGENPDSASLYLNQPITLEAHHSTIAILAGSADSLKLIAYEEDLDPLPADTARLTMIQAVPRGPAVRLQESNQTLIGDQYFGALDTPVEVKAGRQTLNFVSGPDTLESLDMNLSERHVYTLILVGDEGGGNYSTITFNARANSETKVRIIHASPDMPAVDVYLNDTMVASSLGFRSAQGWEAMASMAYTLRVLPAGKPTADPILQKQVTLKPDKTIDLVLLDAVERLRLLEVEEDLSPTPTNGTRLTFVQAAIDALKVSIQSLGGDVPGLLPISFGTASRPTSYTAGEDAFYFITNENGEEREVDTLSPYDWQAGTVYTIVITGYPNTEPLVVKTEVGTNQTFIADEGIANLATEEPIQPVGIRMVNTLSDPIDLTINERPIFQDVQPGQGTVTTTLNEEAKTITIQNSKSGATLDQEPVLWGNADAFTLFVYRDGTGSIRTQIAPDIPFNLADGQAYLRVFDVAFNKESLQVMRQQPRPDQENEGTPGASPVLESIELSDPLDLGVPSNDQVIQAGTFDIQIVESDTQILVITMPQVTVESQGAYDLVILPDASGLSIRAILIPFQ